MAGDHPPRAPQSELSRRAFEAIRLMRDDKSIHPADALAMVVWPDTFRRYLES